ncbi:Spermidine/putrescine import ABC transporter ATP-binding protein PotA (TC 3.A.1.11.1) [hydrothermal vent metagenome]|uniref:Spermidine/putrescine import ABC transporter ATP-binding protein PotA (TC 3.A.1.11.1) n=1 Tax=hydrothermal vent metagenome TaxID=652676 RepID=A0A3B0TW59_9ZZZZ
MTPDLECKNLSKKFGDFTAVDNVSFSVPAGTFFSILGPSGCGKTTIMRMIAGFLETTSGEIEIKGRSMLEVAPNKRPVNMVFQHLALFPMMNIEDNVGYGLRRAGMSKREIVIKVGDVLERIGLPGVQKRKIEQLSGGQKQRIAIARCMVLEPDVLLLDEPLGALDLKLREHMKVELKKLQTSFDTTFIYITHDQSEALVMSDQVAVMNAGRFEQLGAARDLYYKPQTSFVAGFVGDSNRWRGKIENADGASLKMRTKDGVAIVATTSGATLKQGQSAEIFVRPESIRVGLKESDIGHLENRISGKVSSVLFNGANSRILVHDTNTDSEIDVALPQSGEFANLTRGAPVHIGWGGAQSLCFALEDQQ